MNMDGNQNVIIYNYEMHSSGVVILYLPPRLPNIHVVYVC
jgi:hypothetical protein